jgi:hypothetical protein
MGITKQMIDATTNEPLLFRIVVRAVDVLSLSLFSSQRVKVFGGTMMMMMSSTLLVRAVVWGWKPNVWESAIVSIILYCRPVGEFAVHVWPSR